MSADDALTRLTAGLDRDEQIARAAAERAAEWRSDRGHVAGGPFHPKPDWVDADDGWTVAESGKHAIVYDEGWPLAAEAHHIATHDPARVLLGELPLKRLILRDHRPQEKDDGTYCIECSTSLSLNIDEVPWPCEYIRALAGIYTEPVETGGKP